MVSPFYTTRRLWTSLPTRLDVWAYDFVCSCRRTSLHVTFWVSGVGTYLRETAFLLPHQLATTTCTQNALFHLLALFDCVTTESV